MVTNEPDLVRAHHHAAPDLGNASFQPGEPSAKSGRLSDKRRNLVGEINVLETAFAQG
jgi:hypothetical protein